jgi:4,5-dihydroxyphthalate decarboxylase
MTATRELSFAIEAYDRHMPFYMGTAKPLTGIDLKVLDVGMVPPGRDGGNRHARMLRHNEFDIAEVSFSSYVIAKSKGAPFTATPVFPRRLFSQFHMFVNAASGIREPRDLAGKRVAIRTPQVTMSTLAKGDLKTEYGVAIDDVVWVVQNENVIDIPVPDGVTVERMPAERRGEEMLLAGDVDAFIDPRPSELVMSGAGGRVKYLFDDPRAEALRYFKKRGCYPIMHVMAIKNEVADAFPNLMRELIDVWEAAKNTMREIRVDFAWGLSPFEGTAYQHDLVNFGADPYPSGIAVNRANLEWFMDYHVDQQLIPERLPIETLFHPSVLDT